MTAGTQVAIGRQPIFDDKQRIGYELLHRGSDAGPEADDGDLRRTVRTAVAAVLEFGLDRLVGSATAWVNVGAGFVCEARYTVLPPERVVLDVVDFDSSVDELADGLRGARLAGYRASIGIEVVRAHDAGVLLPLVDFVRVDVRTADAAEIIARLADDGRVVLAHKVESLERRTAAQKAGAMLYQGFFFAKPNLLQQRELSPAAVTGLKLIPRSTSSDVDFDTIVDVVSSDPVLAARVLVGANSSFSSPNARVESLHRAVAYLGAERVRQMALLSLLDGCRGAASVEVLRLAALRAALCRALAGVDRQLADLAFTCGLLSVLDVLLGQPMSVALLDGIGLEPDLARAIADKGGEAGAILARTIDLASHEDSMLAADANPLFLAAIEFADHLVGLLEAR